MTPRIRRLISDWEQVREDFAGHKDIVITPLGMQPYETYRITYYVKGIYLLTDGTVAYQMQHDVEIALHSDYPRYKPICKIFTPIWHPNFRDGNICIGDIWGAGESLTDIIVNIGDMIQYKSWNSYSPLSADAAKWAIENKHLFPIGNIELYNSNYSSSNELVEIDLFDDAGNEENLVTEEKELHQNSIDESKVVNSQQMNSKGTLNEKETRITDNLKNITTELEEEEFEITPDELIGIQFIPTAQRMQSISSSKTTSKGKINFKTLFIKGILWGLIGGIIGFVLQELFSKSIDVDKIIEWMGYNFSNLINSNNYTNEEVLEIISNALRISTAIFSAFVALPLGFAMGLGEGIFYGSKEKALRYSLIGLGVSLVLGFLSGYIAQILYSTLLADVEITFIASLVRGIAWALMGLGVGVSIGLIKPYKKRLLFSAIGGMTGGFIGGFIFNYIYVIFSTGADDTGTLSRAIGIILMGILVGLGIGFLEQVAKGAWLKVVRGEFEGKEYLVFPGLTSIGNSGKNTIVLFKDKLVGPHHCDIIQEGSRYYIIDRESVMGTIVNGTQVTKQVLNNGDTISIGNSVLIFNMK